MSKKLRVWHIPQISGETFYVAVSSIEAGLVIIDQLSDYDLFQYNNKIKGDYSNGLHELQDNGDWEEWCDDFTGEDAHEMLMDIYAKRQIGRQMEQELKSNLTSDECKTPDDCRITETVGSITLAYFPPIYDGHGNNLNPDKNTSNSVRRCSPCGKVFK